GTLTGAVGLEGEEHAADATLLKECVVVCCPAIAVQDAGRVVKARLVEAKSVENGRGYDQLTAARDLGQNQSPRRERSVDFEIILDAAPVEADRLATRVA